MLSPVANVVRKLQLESLYSLSKGFINPASIRMCGGCKKMFLPRNASHAASCRNSTWATAGTPNAMLAEHLRQSDTCRGKGGLDGTSDTVWAALMHDRNTLVTDDLQKRAVAMAVDKLVSMYVGGWAGTGKSLFISVVLDILRFYFGSDAVHMVAPTHAASDNLGADAMTWHSFFGLRTETSYTPEVRARVLANSAVLQRLRQLRVIIFDEVGYMSAEQLDMLDALLKDVLGNAKPFGGLQGRVG